MAGRILGSDTRFFARRIHPTVDGWIVTDVTDAVRSLAASCVGQDETKGKRRGSK